MLEEGFIKLKIWTIGELTEASKRIEALEKTVEKLESRRK